MKLLTITVPCYNSASYLKRCIDSLLPGGESIEIILVNDGSTDQTAEIANAYMEQFPSVIKAIHKENGGHGSAVNTGLANASGLFFKVVDSDDRLDGPGLQEMLSFLEKASHAAAPPDMILSNYVYDKVNKKHKYVMKPKGLPKNVRLSWNDAHRIRKYHFILMHSIIYRTDLLRKCGLKLPEHTFYVDNIYAFQPLPYVKTFWYKDINLYWYYIGREDQSVHESNIVRQIDQYIRVVKIMAEQYKESCSITTEKACLNYMLNYLEAILAITCNFLNVGNTMEHMKKKQQLWKDLETIDPELTKILRRRLVLILANLPGRAGRAFFNTFYRILSRLFGLN